MTTALDTGPCLGCMFFGTQVDEPTAFTLLDQYVAGGGRLLDTANNYAVWAPGGTGNESEELLGRWLRSRAAWDEVHLATKVGARPRPGGGTRDSQGLSAAAVREQLVGSLGRLGVDRVDLLYAHIDDTATPLEESAGAFHALVREGLVGAIATSNYTLERQQAVDGVIAEHGWNPVRAMQLRASYLTPAPGTDFGRQKLLTDELLAYALEKDVRVFGYSALLSGAYARPDKPLPEEYVHPGTDDQLAAVRATAERLGLTVNQVVFAWLRERGVTPVLGVSRTDQLLEAMAPAQLDGDARAALDAART